MAKWNIKDPDSGDTLTVEGDNPPTQDDAKWLFSQRKPKEPASVLSKAADWLFTPPKGVTPEQVTDLMVARPQMTPGKSVFPMVSEAGDILRQLPPAETGLGRTAQSLLKGGFGFVEGATTPEMLPIAEGGPVAKALISGMMLKAGLETPKKVKDILDKPGPMTSEDKQKISDSLFEGGLGSYLGVRTGTELGKELFSKPKVQGPIATGEVLTRPKGAAPPVEPKPVEPEAQVVRAVEPGSIDPKNVVPAIRLIGGEVVEGKTGDKHPDIRKREGITADEIDQKVFVDKSDEKVMDREATAQGTQVPTQFEEGRQHSTDLIEADVFGVKKKNLKPNTLYVGANDWSSHTPEQTQLQVTHSGDPLATFKKFKKANPQFAPQVMFATDSEGKPWKVISPNGNVYDFGTPEANYAAGDLNAFRDDAIRRINAAREAGDADTINKIVDERVADAKDLMRYPNPSAQERYAKEIEFWERMRVKPTQGAAQPPAEQPAPKVGEQPRVVPAKTEQPPPSTGATPPSTASPAAATESSASKPGVSPPGTPPAISETTTPKVKAQPKGKASDLETLTAKVESGAKLTPAEKKKYLKLRQEATGSKTEEKPQVESGAGPGTPSAKQGPDVGGGFQDQSGADIYGIAQRVREQRAKSGQVVPIPTGQGVSAEGAVKWGQELIASGVDPESAMRNFEKTKAVSFDSIAIARGHGESLAKAARAIESKFGTNSNEYRMAKKALGDWDARSKAMQTEWHKIGMAQQGETDIDTGSFTGLERAHRQVTGKEFTPEQKPQAEKIANTVKVAEEAETQAREKLNKQIADTIQKEGNAQRKAVWDKAKEYLANGVDNFDDIRSKIATDLGLTVDQVSRHLASNKTTKRLANDAWKKQQASRRLKQQAKLWLSNLETPGFQKALGSIPSLLFKWKVGLHGFVALGTHAPMVAFQPLSWKTYIQNFGRMYKMVFSPAFYERQVQDLIRDRPGHNYTEARRAGLQNDPYQYEEFQTTPIGDMIKGWIGKHAETWDAVTHSGNRGYTVLKILRQDMFDQQWNNLPETLKTPEVASAISDDINHITGVTKGKSPPGSNLAFFAPRLEASRVMWLAGDPARAVKAFANWKNAPDAEKVFAMNQLKSKATVFGTLAGLLALNQGFLSATDSKQKINGIPKSLGGGGFDPLESDFLKFKVAGMDIAYGSAMLNMAKLPVRLATAIAFQGKTSKLILEDERVYKIAGDYLRSQMSPFAGTATDLALGRDFAGRPLPRKLFGALPGDTDIPKRLRLHGVTQPYSWDEYSAEQFSPIPISEAIKEVWGKGGLGMSDEQIAHTLRAWAIFSIMAGTGSRVTEDIPKQPEKPTGPSRFAPVSVP